MKGRIETKKGPPRTSVVIETTRTSVRVGKKSKRLPYGEPRGASPFVEFKVDGSTLRVSRFMPLGWRLVLSRTDGTCTGCTICAIGTWQVDQDTDGCLHIDCVQLALAKPLSGYGLLFDLIRALGLERAAREIDIPGFFADMAALSVSRLPGAARVLGLGLFIKRVDPVVPLAAAA